MNTYLFFGIIFVVLLLAELAYFKIADRFNIIDKPNERSSHSTIVLRGGGIIFLIGAWVWAVVSLLVPELVAELVEVQMVSDAPTCREPVEGLVSGGIPYIWFLIGLTLVAGVSFVDDIRSLPDSVRLVAQFAAMGLMFVQLFVSSPDSAIAGGELWVKVAFVLAALIVCVGASNIINFMDGINGITAGYSLAVMVPLALLNAWSPFIDQSFLVVMMCSLLVFAFFNFRQRGRAKCFAGDVGSVGIAFVMLFCIGMLVMKTGDVTWLVFLLVYGVDGVLTICHRIMLHENLGEAHRKHAYQLMANELKMSHVTVSLIYIGVQLVVSLGFIYLIPNTIVAHWIYLVTAALVLAVAYVLFKMKYYHLHEEYLASLKK